MLMGQLLRVRRKPSSAMLVAADSATNATTAGWAPMAKLTYVTPRARPVGRLFTKTKPADDPSHRDRLRDLRDGSIDVAATHGFLTGGRWRSGSVRPIRVSRGDPVTEGGRGCGS